MSLPTMPSGAEIYVCVLPFELLLSSSENSSMPAEGKSKERKIRVKTIRSRRFYDPQLRMMIREVENIIAREITADEWNSL